MRFAKQLARELLQKHGIPAAVEDLDAYDHECLATLDRNIAVGFVVSTFGEGDPPDNATGLYETLSRWKGNAAADRQQTQPLKDMRYFTFGLGSTKYQDFNGYVKTLDAQLLALGAQRLGPVGLRDEADSRTDETTWLPWKDAVANELLRFEPSLVTQPVTSSAQSTRMPDYIVEETAPRARLRGVMHAGEHNAEQSRGRIKVYAAPVKNSRLLSATIDGGASPPRTYIHIEFDLSSARPPLSYQTGDHVAVWPINNDNEVVHFQQAFGWSSAQINAPIEIRPQNSSHQDATMPPSPTTRASLLRFYFDICGVVTRETLQLLADLAPTTAARQYIESLYADDQAYNTQVVRQHLTCGQIMATAMQLAPMENKVAPFWPQELFSLFLQTLPPLQPRYFSIASSPRVSSTTVAITVGVVTTPVAIGNPTKNNGSERDTIFHGLTTNYLHALHKRVSVAVPSASSVNGKSTTWNQPSYTLAGPRGMLAGSKALLQIRPSNFRMPADPTVPLILVAAGSGIAPFVGFMQERELQLAAGTAVAPTILFFGCRAPEQDYLYAKEWARLEQLEPNVGDHKYDGGQRFFSMYTAFSRSGPSKVYVQDRVQQEQQQVARLLTGQRAAVYICGSTAMATDVKTVLQKCLETTGLSSDSAQLFMRDLKKDKKLQEDVWA
ncbi:NADPH-cytochrome P450 reductase [Sporothrix bragantina]|uniref:NADPH-cytochrome P450 reductase n=1 Tax=Sporothrix bragantina TaxID=671064 RepID=A0ABP0CP64_9PEZI